jgi:hypothetical protein
MEDGYPERNNQLHAVPEPPGARVKERKELKMTRKILLSMAVLLTLALYAPAGEIKIHQWPTAFIPQEVTTVPVVMDVGFYVRIEDKDNLRIKLQQTAINRYRGCTDVKVSTNFNMTLSCDIASTGAVGGKYSCSVSPADLDSPGGTVQVCAELEDADLIGVPGGTRDVHVATVTIKVVPR